MPVKKRQPLTFTEKTVAALPVPTDKPQAYYFDDETKGFGVVVGRTGVRTFFASAWVAGKSTKRRFKIGVHGAVRPDRHVWNVALARKRAKELIGDAAKGIDHNADKRASKLARDGALTLRQALKLYTDELEDNHKSPRSIATVAYDVPRLLSKWLDKPLADLTVERVQEIKERGRKHKTQTNRLLAHISAIWNTALRLRRTTFAAPNPIGLTAVRRYKLDGTPDEPDRLRVEDEDLPEWLRRVETLQPLRRDLQLVTLFTGLRDSNVTNMRWEDLNLSDTETIKIGKERVPPLTFAAPRSKTTPFKIPLGPTVVEILRRRREENAVLFPDGDGGFVFPSWSRDRTKVIATPETKERRPDTVARPWRQLHDESYKPTGARVLYLPGLHDLRRTFTSVADDLDISDRTQHQLTNHKPRTTHDKYTIKSPEALRSAIERIDAGLWVRLRPPAKQA